MKASLNQTDRALTRPSTRAPRPQLVISLSPRLQSSATDTSAFNQIQTRHAESSIHRTECSTYVTRTKVFDAAPSLRRAARRAFACCVGAGDLRQIRVRLASR